MADTWVDKWALIESRWETCVLECLRGGLAVEEGTAAVRPDPMLCKGAIEALASDIWALVDWLTKDPTSGLNGATVHAFVRCTSPDAFGNVR